MAKQSKDMSYNTKIVIVVMIAAVLYFVLTPIVYSMSGWPPANYSNPPAHLGIDANDTTEPSWRVMWRIIVPIGIFLAGLVAVFLPMVGKKHG